MATIAPPLSLAARRAFDNSDQISCSGESFDSSDQSSCSETLHEELARQSVDNSSPSGIDVARKAGQKLLERLRATRESLERQEKQQLRLCAEFEEKLLVHAETRSQRASNTRKAVHARSVANQGGA